MKIHALIIFSFWLISASCNQKQNKTQNTNWSEVKERGSGTVTLAYVTSDGFSYEDENGHLTGVTIEIVRDFVEYVSSEKNVSLNIHYQPVDRFGDFYEYVKISRGGVFGVANVTITEERRKELAFSPPYMTNIATLITHHDVAEIHNFEEIKDKFSGLNALAFEGTLHEERLRNIVEHFIPDAFIDFAHSNNEIIEQTSAGNEYFAYVDIYNYWRATEQGLPLRRQAAGDEASEQFGIIMPLDSDWHELVRSFFEQGDGYTQSTRYRQIMEDHLGKELADLLLNQMD